MLNEYRYKIKDMFVTYKGEVYVGKDRIRKLRYSKPRPRGMFFYKPTKKKYDYFDYTGWELGERVLQCELTHRLLKMGLIDFVSRKSGD